MAAEFEVAKVEVVAESEKSTQGWSWKPPKLNHILFSQIETIFTSLKNKLLSILSNHVAEALTPPWLLLNE